jgi:uncharacterized protein with HEPN domain
MCGVQTVHERISNQQKVDAVMLNLEQIGETAKKLTLQTKTNFLRFIGLASSDYEI